MSTSSELVLKAKDYAILKHFETNHKYDGKPYEVHLEMAFEFACKFVHLLPDDKTISEVLAAVWAHDVIEDCRQNYSDVKNVLGEIVAEIVYALTNEKGKNRKERANDKYYEGIRNTPFADYVKICDRLANVTYSKLGVGIQPTTLTTTSLPTTGLYDGYTVDYADSLIAPTYIWRLRYSAALTKWMYVGGSDYKSEKYPTDPTNADNTVALSADTYTTLPSTASATITAPLTGTYDIYHWGHIAVASVSGHSSTNVYMNFKINSGAASSNTPWVMYAPDANVGSGNIYSGCRTSRLSLTASNVLTCQFATSTANTIRNYRHGIFIKPVIIG
jgi:hypothetical protein